MPLHDAQPHNLHDFDYNSEVYRHSIDVYLFPEEEPNPL